MLNSLKRTLFGRRELQDVSADQRRHPRRPVLLKASVYAIDFLADVVIHDVSANGFMGEADVELNVGETVHLTLDNKAYQTGTVKWAKGRNFGVMFETPLAQLGVDETGIDYGILPEHKPRARRVSLNIPASINLSRPAAPATVKNLSKSGLLLETAAELEAHQHILVKLGDRSPVVAVVRWRSEDHVGVETAEPIGLLSLVYSSE